MERELWTTLYQLAQACDTSGTWFLGKFWYREIVGVFFWAVLHDRPVCWACEPVNWPKHLWKGDLPSQSTMSRRLRTTEVQHLLHLMEQRMIRLQRGGWVMIVDGKPLVVGTHSKDADAPWGRAGRGFAKGYKLHAIYGMGPLPLAWDVVAMNVGEPDVAARLISTLGRGGYVLGDKIFDSNPLHDICWSVGAQLVAQRKRPGTGLGHRHHSPGRMRCIELLEHEFGQMLYHCRDDIERQWGWLTNHAGGLAPLPNWVRRTPRVRIWVQAKLLIHATYVHLRHPTSRLAVA